MATFDDFLTAARKAADEYELDLALVHFSTAEQLLAAISDPVEKKEKQLQLFQERSEILLMQSEWEDALLDLEEAIPLAKELNKPRVVVESMLDKGRIILNKGGLNDAKNQFQDAFNIATENDFEDIYPECHYYLGSTLAKLGERDKALMIFESGLRIADRVEADADIKAGIQIEMGLLHFRMGMMDDAVDFYKQVLTILESEELSLKKADAHRYLGVIYSIKRLFVDCLESYQNAIHIFSQLNNWHGLGKTYRSVGQAYMDMGFLAEAIFFLERSRDIYKEIDAKSDLGMIYGKLGDAWIEKGDFMQAVLCYQNDLQISEELNNTHNLAYTYANLGKLYRLQKDWTNAEKYYEKSYQFFSSVQDQLNTGKVFLEMAFLHTEMKDPDKALDYAKTAEQIFKENQKKKDLAMVNVSYGIYSRLKKKWDEAGTYFESAINVLREGKKSINLSEAFYQYGMLYKDQRDDEQALTYFKRAFEIAEELKAVRQVEKCLEQITKIDEMEVIGISIKRLKEKQFNG